MATNDLSFLQEPTEVSPGAAELVSELLSNLPPSAAPQGPPTASGRLAGEGVPAPPPQPEQAPVVSGRQRVFGGISDALLAYSNVMAGGQAGVGPFATGVRRDKEAFESRSAASKVEGRRIRVAAEAQKRRILIRSRERDEDRVEAEIVRSARERSNYRKTLIETATDLGVLKEGENPLEMSEEKLVGRIGDFDATAGNEAMLAGVKPGFHAYDVRYDKKRRITGFSTRPDKSDKSNFLTFSEARQASAMGIDPTPSMDPNDPLTESFRDSAKRNAGINSKAEVLELFDTLGDIEEGGLYDSTGKVNRGAEMMGSFLLDIRKLRAVDASEDDVIKFYKAELSAAMGIAADGRTTLDVVGELNQDMIKALELGWPGISLPDVSKILNQKIAQSSEEAKPEGGSVGMFAPPKFTKEQLDELGAIQTRTAGQAVTPGFFVGEVSPTLTPAQVKAKVEANRIRLRGAGN